MHYKGKDDKKAIEWANIGAQNDCDMSAFIVANVDEYQEMAESCYPFGLWRYK